MKPTLFRYTLALPLWVTAICLFSLNVHTALAESLQAVTTISNGAYKPHGVVIQPIQFAGKDAIAVELAPDVQQRILSGDVGASNGPTYAIADIPFQDGVIELDIAAEINGKGQADARGFAGIAFHLNENDDTYEAVYLRMANGTLNQPPPPAPRDKRAVQYVAHPNFHFYVSRQEAPGKYEKPAPVSLGRWYHLRLAIKGADLRASVDGIEVLHVTDLKYAGRSGRVGLWVDDGTRGYFRNLQVSH